jgi:hypothetical protein
MFPLWRLFYSALLSNRTHRVSPVNELPYPTPTEAAYFAAGKLIVNRCDLLLAVWDGQPAGGLGGTGDIVGYARTNDVAVEIVWPDGSSRR